MFRAVLSPRRTSALIAVASFFVVAGPVGVHAQSADPDGDGYPDATGQPDYCPNQPGGAGGPYNQPGCPVPPDSDGDGYVDTQDGCPSQAGGAGSAYNQPGCPVAKDSDGDALYDSDDNCPTVPNADQADRDKDGAGDRCDDPYVAPPAGSRTTTRTLEPGGSMSTRSDTSRSNPIALKITAHGGGRWYIDEIPNPDRPGDSPNAEGSERDPKDWYGPAIRLTPPSGLQEDQWVRIETTIDGSANLANGYQYPLDKGGVWSCGGAAPGSNPPASLGKSSIKYLANGDVRTTFIARCYGASVEWHYFNPKWGIDRRENTTAPGDESLNEVLKNGSFGMHIACKLRCERRAVATIKASSAKALGLRSNVIARGSSGMRFDPDERHCPSKYLSEFTKYGPQDRCVALVLTSQAKKKLKSVRKITVNFKWTATGARAGQKASGAPSQVYKRTTADEDDLG